MGYVSINMGQTYVMAIMQMTLLYIDSYLAFTICGEIMIYSVAVPTIYMYHLWYKTWNTP